MSAPQHVAALEAIASQLLEALDQYEAGTGAMITAWPDLDRYHEVSDLVEKIRMYSSALPQARVQWVELLIAHAELVHVLWRAQYGHYPGARSQVEEVRAHHADCVRALRQRCLRQQAGV